MLLLEVWRRLLVLKLLETLWGHLLSSGHRMLLLLHLLLLLMLLLLELLLLLLLHPGLLKLRVILNGRSRVLMRRHSRR